MFFGLEYNYNTFAWHAERMSRNMYQSCVEMLPDDFDRLIYVGF